MNAIRSRKTPFTFLQFFMGFTFIIVWLPLLRCAFDGRSYSWGMTYFGKQFFSEGISADYAILPVFFLFYLALFWSVYFARTRLIFYILAILWFIHVFGNLLFDIWVLGDTEFHGDTLNVHVSLSTIVYPLAIVVLGLIIWVFWKDKRLPRLSIPWHRKNQLGVWAILITTLIAGVLFITGEPHGTTDQVGVIIAIVQCFAWPFIFSPFRNKI